MKRDPAASSSRAHGHPLTVAAVVGSFAVTVGLLVRVSGMIQGTEGHLSERYQEAGFPIEVGGQPWWAIIILLGLTYGLAYLLLEVPGTGRRVMLAITALVLAAAASPVLALWGVFWSPLVAILSGGWSAFCATLWASHHPMPCELRDLPGEGKVISIAEKERKIS